MQLSPNFSLAEATKSNTAKQMRIRNNPSKVVLQNMIYASEKLEIVRNEILGVPLVVSSWYRSPALNKAIGGTPGGHPTGFCIDFKPVGISIGEAYRRIKEYRDKNPQSFFYDQLIDEFNRWIHISFDHTRKRNQAFKKR